MERSILHMDLDSFFVSCERQMDSSLYNKPILVGGTSNRGIVSAASYEARKFGIHSGMPMKMAKIMCPEAITIKGNSSIYTKFSKNVTDVLMEEVPLLEKASIDEFYIDMTGMDKFFGCYKFASNLRQKVIKETGLPISFGLSSNKTVSKVATGEAKPQNQMKIDFGMEKTFLAPLSVKKIPGVGLKTFNTLSHLGIKTVNMLQQIPINMVESVLGKNGSKLWYRANGIDNTPVIQYSERKSISNERTFNIDTADIELLQDYIKAMAENLSYQLRKGGKLTGCISIKVRYSDFSTHSKQIKVEYTNSDHKLIPVAVKLFQSLYNRRVLVRLIGVKFTDLITGTHQFSLFEDDSSFIKLYGAMDKLRDKFGCKAVVKASSLNTRTIGSNTNPFNGEPPVVLAHRKS